MTSPLGLSSAEAATELGRVGFNEIETGKRFRLVREGLGLLGNPQLRRRVDDFGVERIAQPHCETWRVSRRCEPLRCPGCDGESIPLRAWSSACQVRTTV